MLSMLPYLCFPPENPEENLFVVHKVIKDLSLQEASAEDMAFREGNRNPSFLTWLFGWIGWAHRMWCFGCVLLKRGFKQWLQNLIRECCLLRVPPYPAFQMVRAPNCTDWCDWLARQCDSHVLIGYSLPPNQAFFPQCGAPDGCWTASGMVPKQV